MTTLKAIFLSQFDERWRAPLLDFAARLSDSKSDVLIFMARKSACLYHSFEDVKLARASSQCVSDLCLDGDLSWLRGKSVELVDDTLISGTTLSRAASRLEEAQVARFETTVFCADNRNWSRDLVRPREPILVAEPHDITSFSAQAVRALSVIPRPYLIDFPLYGHIRIPGASLDGALRKLSWTLDDLTSDAQRAAGASAISLSPPPSELRLFDRDLGWECSEFSQLMKIRLYSRRKRASSGGYVHFCRALPVVAFDPLKKTEIDRLWIALVKNAGVAAGALGSLSTQRERLRLIQFYCAARLFRYWFNLMNQLGAAKQATFELDRRQIDFCFPPPVSDAVFELLKDGTPLPLAGVLLDEAVRVPARQALQMKSRFAGFDPIGVQAKLVEPFEYLYREKELPSRKLVKRHGKKVFELPEYRDLVDRLQRGISLPELRSTVQRAMDANAARIFTSMFIDDAIDRGIAVPITVEDESFVYRAFRHGEDVKFTDIEARLTCLLLQQAANELGMTSVPRLVAEKLIVLAIKGGLSRGFMERWIGNLADRKAAGIRFYLQGAVAQLAPDIRPYQYAPGESLTQVLKGWGYLREPKKNEHYSVVLPQRPPTSESSEQDARVLGLALGLALKKVGRSVQDDELTLVATCLTPPDVASALAAEIHYFAAHWEGLTEVLQSGLPAIRSEELLRSSNTYEAVNSGAWKWRKYKSGAPRAVVQEWGRRLADVPNGLFAQAAITSAFPDSSIEWRSKSLDRLIEDEARWILRANVLLRLKRIDLLANFSTAARDLVQRLATDGVADSQFKRRADASYVPSQQEPVQRDEANAISQLADTLESSENKESAKRGAALRQALREADPPFSSERPASVAAEKARRRAYLRIVRIVEQLLRASDRSVEELKEQIAELGEDIRSLSPRIDGPAGQLSLPLSSSAHLDQALAPPPGASDELMFEAAALLDRVDALVSPYGRPRTYSEYRHVALLNIAGTAEQRQSVVAGLLPVIRVLIRQASETKGGAELVVPAISGQLGDVDMAVIASGPFARAWLMKACGEIVSKIEADRPYRLQVWVDLESDESVLRTENRSDVLARNLQIRARSLSSHIESEAEYCDIRVISPKGEEVVAQACAELSQACRVKLVANTTQTVAIPRPHIRSYAVSALGRVRADESVERVDVGIIAIVPEEMAAVVDMLKSFPGFERQRKGASTYYVGQLPAEGGVYHRVAAVQQLEQGNRSVALAFDRLCNEFNPEIVCLVGIAGAIDSDLNLGDVVVADQVIWYEQATERDEGTTRKGEAFKIPATVRALVNDFFAQNGYPYEIPKEGNGRSRIHRVFMAPVGTGEKVVRYRESEIRAWLQGFNYKCAALETEAGGLVQAFYESDLSVTGRVSGFLVVRGISDHADKDKDDRFRKIASLNACSFLRHLLASMPKVGVLLHQQDRLS